MEVCEDETGTGSGAGGSSEGEEVATLRSIAEEMRNDRVASEEGKDDDDGDFGLKPAKIFKLTSGKNGEDEESQKNKPLMMTMTVGSLQAQHELRMQLFKLLKRFLKCAFTIIIRMRKLCPSDAFEMTRVLGVRVPRFLHPSSLEYVEEVAKKFVLFLHRNTAEGCAMHIMIEKNKTMHVVQRFVFRTMGSLDSPNNEDETLGIDLDEVKARCRASLLQIIHSESIRPMTAPQYSRWSISIGLKKEFIVQEEMEQLWSNDPSGNYFPWKKRIRSLANVHKYNEDKTDEVSNAAISNNNDSDNSSQPKSVEMTSDCQIVATVNPEIPVNEDRPICASTQKGSIMQISHLGRSTTRDNSKPSNGSEAGKITCFPLSSFPITANFMFSIYGLEYPAPINSIVHSPFSPRINRGTHISLRMSQFKHKLLRHSGNKY